MFPGKMDYVVPPAGYAEIFYQLDVPGTPLEEGALEALCPSFSAYL